MKYFLSCCVTALVVMFPGTSCTKQTAETNPANTIPRKVQFVLYTDKDFADSNSIITFKLSIQKTGDQVLWDSVLPPMKIKDIPGPANKWVIEKWVPGNDPSLLKIGFYYTIENVGNSWYIDSFKTGDTFKSLEFNFR